MDPFRTLRLDKRSSVPAYVQIAEALARLLQNKTLPPGFPLPPERILCRQFGVSRMTLRQAMGILEREGLILSQRGRGTFVAHDLLHKQQQEMRGFSEEVLARGGVPESELLSFERKQPGDAAREFFGLAAGERVYEIRRSRLSDGVPLALELVRLPEKLCPDLDRHDLGSQSLYRVLEESYGLRLGRCDEEVTAALPTAEQKRLLKLPRGTAILLIYRKTYSDTGMPVELTDSAYRGDRYSAVIHSIRKRRGP